MGNIVTPILDGLGFARLGNIDLNSTSKAVEQLLKTVSSPADFIASLNDLQKSGELNPDLITGLISAAKTLEALAGFFVKISSSIGIGLSVFNLGANLEKARRELVPSDTRPNPTVEPNTKAAITADFLAIIGGVVLAAGAVGAAGTAGLVRDYRVRDYRVRDYRVTDYRVRSPISQININ
jgi:hypothetical protein